MPAKPREKARWPFPVTDDQPSSKAEDNSEDPGKPTRPAKAGS